MKSRDSATWRAWLDAARRDDRAAAAVKSPLAEAVVRSAFAVCDALLDLGALDSLSRNRRMRLRDVRVRGWAFLRVSWRPAPLAKACPDRPRATNPRGSHTRPRERFWSGKMPGESAISCVGYSASRMKFGLIARPQTTMLTIEDLRLFATAPKTRSDPGGWATK
jgi:hypothetical protein